MSDLKKRLDNIERQISLKEVSIMPDFSKWSEEELDRYIIGGLNKFHIENRIKNFEEAKKVLNSELARGLLSQQEYEHLIGAEKFFWQEASKSDSPVFFV